MNRFVLEPRLTPKQVTALTLSIRADGGRLEAPRDMQPIASTIRALEGRGFLKMHTPPTSTVERPVITPLGWAAFAVRMHLVGCSCGSCDDYRRLVTERILGRKGAA